MRSAPLDPYPCNNKTNFLGRPPDKGCRLEPFDILDKKHYYSVGARSEPAMRAVAPFRGSPLARSSPQQSWM